ncbi:hypothetical protein cypCar_00035512 [Cyprinus carpio]|nr:hypothetical protein cypCar_00035512 [Cyprinus carpio]
MKTKINCNYILRGSSISLNEDMETLIKEYVIGCVQFHQNSLLLKDCESAEG